MANRVGETRMHSNAVQWQYVPSTHAESYISDLKGTQVEELADRSLWWEGPEWLLQDPTRWPKLDIGLPKVVKFSTSDNGFRVL